MSYELLDKKFDDNCIYKIWYELEHSGYNYHVIKSFLDCSSNDLNRISFFEYIIDNGEFNNITDLLDLMLSNSTDRNLEKFYRELIKFYSTAILPYLP